MISDTTQVDTNLTQEGKISLGEKLKTTRETLGLSPQEAASRLNLSPRFIHLLENEDLLHTSLPAIYLRGYLRSYARILNIPEKELACVLDKLDPTPAIVPPAAIPADSLSLSFPLENNNLYIPRLGTFLASLLLLSALMTWWYLHGNAPTQSATAIASTQSLASTPVPTLLDNNPGSAENKESPVSNQSLTLANSNNAPQSETTTPAPAAVTVPPNPQLALAPTSNTEASIKPKSVAPKSGREEGEPEESADEPE